MQRYRTRSFQPPSVMDASSDCSSVRISLVAPGRANRRWAGPRPSRLAEAGIERTQSRGRDRGWNSRGQVREGIGDVEAMSTTTENIITRATATAPLALTPLNATSLRDQAYSLIKTAIADTDLYNPKQELRLDE